MKTHYNLSEIMHNAHDLFRNRQHADRSIRETMDFAYCLREAWKAAKRNLGRIVSMIWMWGLPTVKVRETTVAIAAEYADGTNGRRYFGD